METKMQINTRMVEYKCDKCGEGKMIPTGIVLLTYPGQYEHKCNNCGFIMNFFAKYPYVEYFNPEEPNDDSIVGI